MARVPLTEGRVGSAPLIHTRVTAAMHAAIERRVIERGCSRSTVLRELLEHALADELEEAEVG
jgi:hypothetical protein